MSDAMQSTEHNMSKLVFVFTCGEASGGGGLQIPQFQEGVDYQITHSRDVAIAGNWKYWNYRETSPIQEASFGQILGAITVSTFNPSIRACLGPILKDFATSQSQ